MFSAALIQQLLSCSSGGDHLVWPVPQSIHVSGVSTPLSPAFKVSFDVPTPLLENAANRFMSKLVDRGLGAAPTAPQALSELHVSVQNSSDEYLGISTRYDYTISVSGGTAAVTANSPFGAMYALETFSQLADGPGAALRFSEINISDAPDFPWRGLMIDSGRRFVNVPTLQNIMETMASVKLNVLHLHASDMCRFGVESKLFPNLTASLTGIHAGFYTQDDIRTLIQYGKARGIRVVPEFDIPGHSRGFIPVESEGLEFCTDSDSRSQLLGNPGTFKLLHSLLGEMSSLFTDEVFNIGCDETSAKGNCTVKSSFDIERKVLDAVAYDFKKTPEGWEEVLFDAGAATNATIVNAWTRHTAAEITATGRRAIESRSRSFYFTSAVPGGPAGWSKCWYDIATNVPSSQRNLLLGGEMSMWTDTYCYVEQCGASTGRAPPVGSRLFGPEMDEAFGKSIGGMIWPRGYVGAAAFWNYNSTADPAAPSFVNAVWAQNDRNEAAGGLVCKSKCSCDQVSACGVPYLPPPPPPPPPSAGALLGLAHCTFGMANSAASAQRFEFGSDGTLKNGGLCVTSPGIKAYPLKLSKCPAAGDTVPAAMTFSHSPKTSELVSGNGQCVDVKSRDSVGSWDCGSDQPNQQWAVDTDTMTIASLGTYLNKNFQDRRSGAVGPSTDTGGLCLAVLPGTM